MLVSFYFYYIKIVFKKIHYFLVCGVHAGDQRSAFSIWLSPYTIRVPGLELRPLGLEASAFPRQAISPALVLPFDLCRSGWLFAAGRYPGSLQFLPLSSEAQFFPCILTR